MLSDKPFTKENLDSCLRELAKVFKKMNGNRMPAEIILIGGASVLVNYGFRDMTYDVDAIINSSSVMKDAITLVGDKLGFPFGWLNTDFMKTESYSSKLVQYSKYYKTFSNIMQVRTISAEYLIAMKLMSGRQYKNDLSDVVGILEEQKQMGHPLSLEEIKEAVSNLYGSYNKLSANSMKFVESLFERDDISAIYQKIRDEEIENKNILIDFEKKYTGKLNNDNIADVIKAAKEKKLKE